MLLRASAPGVETARLEPGVNLLWGDRTIVPAAASYALFGLRSPLLPSNGVVEVEVVGALDGRRYALRRALDVPEHWQVIDVETGWLAANTSETEDWLRRNLEVADELSLQ